MFDSSPLAEQADDLCLRFDMGSAEESIPISHSVGIFPDRIHFFELKGHHGSFLLYIAPATHKHAGSAFYHVLVASYLAFVLLEVGEVSQQRCDVGCQDLDGSGFEGCVRVQGRCREAARVRDVPQPAPLDQGYADVQGLQARRGMLDCRSSAEQRYA